MVEGLILVRRVIIISIETWRKLICGIFNLSKSVIFRDIREHTDDILLIEKLKSLCEKGDEPF